MGGCGDEMGGCGDEMGGCGDEIGGWGDEIGGSGDEIGGVGGETLSKPVYSRALGEPAPGFFIFPGVAASFSTVATSEGLAPRCDCK
jgi:hypothetical protein